MRRPFHPWSRRAYVTADVAVEIKRYSARQVRPPSIPSNEPERLRALADYKVLDTAPETQFDALTKLAAIVLGVPIALVSLVDVNRQWFKSRVGLGAVETSRDVSFCGHAVAMDALLIVPDAFSDERFVDNPLVTGIPHMRFYAGVPLRSHDGFVLGTLCAIDQVPREPTAEQIEALHLIAGQVMALFELRRVGSQLRDERRALAEQKNQLADRERQLQSLFEGMVEGVVLRDAAGAVLHHNAAAEAILGMSHDELTGLSGLNPSWRATHPDGTPFADEDQPSLTALRTGQPQTDVVAVIRTVTGEQRWLSINARPLNRPGETAPYAVITTFRDITEQRTLAERLSQHQRLVTTGTLAAGVGHEINNPLTYLLANLDMAIEELELLGGGSPSKRILEVVGLLDQAREGGDRVKRIVRGLKSLVRENDDAVPTILGNIINSALSIANHELRSHATVKVDLVEVPPVRVDESRLTQVLVNLLVNAAQAFRTSTPDTNEIVVRTSSIGANVAIDVTDNGPGISPDVLPRIFDPFFTTKAIGAGTGLGLFISHGIVTAFGGSLECTTQLGRGTTFRVTLPSASEPVPEVPRPVRPARGRVLIVDDEPTILRSMSRMLGGEFEVVVHDDSREALRLIETGEQFDVVFCDISMPHMSGMDLHDKVSLVQPGIAERFVFMSGDITRDDIRRFLARVPNERLEKPFSLQNLRGIARRFVESRSQREQSHTNRP